MFDWDDANRDHISEHRIYPYEAEEALLAPRRVAAPAYSLQGERRRGVLGETDSGRLLFVVFTHRRGLIRVVTARDATPRERLRYRR